MPLFGHKNKHNNDAAERDTMTGTGTGRHHGTGAGMTGTGANTTGAYYGYDDTAGTGFNNPPAGGHGMTTQGYGNNAAADPYSNTIGNNDPSVPPAAHINAGNQHHPSGGAGTRMAGKMEHAVGTMVGSQALKTKGIQKEQEAQAFKMQSAEIAEAERLEREATLRRERAVQHGAHPQNKQLGGGVGAQEYGNNFGGPGSAGIGPTGGPGGQVM
ncbi:hypothetical protein K474DRAFT_1532576 [Panus rudis PR-1116 ss-1]|nr:hypothetical protein K474DRAFT_1532576 [Panus rudis PR-1116 ss-1]